MKLYVKLDCKFRAWFITFGTVSKEWSLPLPPLSIPFPTQSLINFSDRGVKLVVDIRQTGQI